MRIAVSGSHSLGKSTVVNDWIASHPEYRREEEPYRALSLYGPYEVRFRDESTRLHNGLQLFYNISRIHLYAEQKSRVIFDRSPVDYIAYSQYTADQGTTDIDHSFVEMMVPAVREALDRIDILAFVPRSDEWPVALENDGIRPVDQAYRDDVDEIFKQIYRNGRYGLFPGSGGPKLIELFGSPGQRIMQLEEASSQHHISG